MTWKEWLLCPYLWNKAIKDHSDAVDLAYKLPLGSPEQWAAYRATFEPYDRVLKYFGALLTMIVIYAGILEGIVILIFWVAG